MTRLLYKLIGGFFLMLIPLSSFAQKTQEATRTNNVEMADAMREEGKIYVVVAIILIVLAGLILYLFLMDRKVTKLEKRIERTP
jgi:hypothetical protein